MNAIINNQLTCSAIVIVNSYIYFYRCNRVGEGEANRRNRRRRSVAQWFAPKPVVSQSAQDSPDYRTSVSVIELLPDEKKGRAKDELKILEQRYNNEYQ